MLAGIGDAAHQLAVSGHRLQLVPAAVGGVVDLQTDRVRDQVHVVDGEARRLAVLEVVERRPVRLVADADDRVLADPGELVGVQGRPRAARRAGAIHTEPTSMNLLAFCIRDRRQALVQDADQRLPVGIPVYREALRVRRKAGIGHDTQIGDLGLLCQPQGDRLIADVRIRLAPGHRLERGQGVCDRDQSDLGVFVAQLIGQWRLRPAAGTSAAGRNREGVPVRARSGPVADLFQGVEVQIAHSGFVDETEQQVPRHLAVREQQLAAWVLVIHRLGFCSALMRELAWSASYWRFVSKYLAQPPSIENTLPPELKLLAVGLRQSGQRLLIERAKAFDHLPNQQQGLAFAQAFFAALFAALFAAFFAAFLQALLLPLLGPLDNTFCQHGFDLQ